MNLLRYTTGVDLENLERGGDRLITAYEDGDGGNAGRRSEMVSQRDTLDGSAVKTGIQQLDESQHDALDGSVGKTNATVPGGYLNDTLDGSAARRMIPEEKSGAQHETLDGDDCEKKGDSRAA
ncbi:hypothetical protein E4U09_000156 [Claviceps aff. purpurea]|uniref:Uncharacterized protein n=1 Tax=Claviceps aff. purpurea TaxID=1967640 RepID=A0A9P7U4G7_9HYPO|nr:hypothetical protein E4U09_000156 [Claviceps aff. purpurea]